MGGNGVRQTRHTIVAIPQDLNAKTTIPLHMERKGRESESRRSELTQSKSLWGNERVISGWVSWHLHLGDLVESAEELVEHSDQLFGCAGARQLCEAHDVGVQDAT